MTDKANESQTRLIEILLTAFEFPKKLDSNKANFRFVVDVRYVDQKGNLATHHAVMPSMDTYWECDTDKKGAPNYVRASDCSANDSACFQFKSANQRETGVDPWDSLVFLGKVKLVHSIQVKIFDVDRPDFWDKLQEALGGLITAVFGRAKSVIHTGEEGSLKSDVSGVFGSFVDDVTSSVLKRLSNGDRVLFRGSTACCSQEDPVIQGQGTKGHYSVRFTVGGAQYGSLRAAVGLEIDAATQGVG
jgi:hypothetical protein